MNGLPGSDQILYREVEVDREALATRAAGDDRIPVVLATEARVERWFGREILSMEHGAVDLSRATPALPLLDVHDPTRQVGSVADIHIRDRKLRGYLRQGNHPDAAWIFADIRDGHRTGFSIGYRVHEMSLVEQAQDGDVFRADRWELFEASTLPIPADIAAGAYRAAALDTNSRGTPMSEQHPPVSVGPDRNLEAAEISRLCAAHGVAERAGDFIAQNWSLERVKSELFDAKVRAARPVTVPGHLDLSVNDTRQLLADFRPGVLALANRRPDDIPGALREASDTIARRLGRSTSGFFLPLDMQLRASVTGNVAGTSSLGGAGVQTTVLSLIELLRNRMLVRRLGAQVLSGLSGNITFPRQITANTFSWTGENPATGAAETAATLDNVTLSPKTAIGRSAYSRQLFVQSSFDVNAFVANDLTAVLALGLDAAAIDGTGSNNQPKGIMRQDNVNTATFTGTDGGVPTWEELVAFETKVEEDNATDLGSRGWITTPGLKGKLKTTLKSTTAGSTFLWETDNTVNGYPAFATNQMPSNYTAGTNTTAAHGVLYGAFSEALIGEWGGAVELIVDPYSYASQAMVAVTAIMMADVAVRHPGAFVVNKTALTS